MAGRFLRLPQRRATRTLSSILNTPVVRSSHRIQAPLAWGLASNSFKNCHRWMWEPPLPLACGDAVAACGESAMSSSSSSGKRNKLKLHYLPVYDQETDEYVRQQAVWAVSWSNTLIWTNPQVDRDTHILYDLLSKTSLASRHKHHSVTARVSLHGNGTNSPT